MYESVHTPTASKPARHSSGPQRVERGQELRSRYLAAKHRKGPLDNPQRAADSLTRDAHCSRAERAPVPHPAALLLMPPKPPPTVAKKQPDPSCGQHFTEQTIGK